MSSELYDFDFELPEDPQSILQNLSIHNESNSWELLAPSFYTKQKLTQSQPFSFK